MMIYCFSGREELANQLLTSADNCNQQVEAHLPKIESAVPQQMRDNRKCCHIRFTTNVSQSLYWCSHTCDAHTRLYTHIPSNIAKDVYRSSDVSRCLLLSDDLHVSKLLHVTATRFTSGARCTTCVPCSITTCARPPPSVLGLLVTNSLHCR